MKTSRSPLLHALFSRAAKLTSRSSEIDISPVKAESGGESDATVGKSKKKPRLSPRKSEKKDYNALANPKVEEDADGEDAAEDEASSGEGSYPSDPDFHLSEAV